MRNGIILFVFIFMLYGCSSNEKKVPLKSGIWQAELKVMDNQLLPFNFELQKTPGGVYSMNIFNAEELIQVDEISIAGDSILIKTPVFEGYIAGTFTENSISGEFIKESLDRIVPFSAQFGEPERFPNVEKPLVDISGIWETAFSPETDDTYMGKGIFTQKNGRVTGTFRTTTGDYRYLDGVMDGDSLKLSAFDGAHAFLFTGKVADSVINGTFYSGNHFKEPFVAKRNSIYELPSPDSLTFLNEGYEKLAFSFPDSSGNMVSLEDERFKGKVVIVQIMGTWCPNCLDETKFLVDYTKKNFSEDLEIIGLAFEYAKTSEGAQKSIKRLVDRVGVPYPILLAQYGTEDKKLAQEKLPMLNHVLSYPTTIFIDKKGEVRKIHTGFNGPATGEKYVAFKQDFNTFVNTLLKE